MAFSRSFRAYVCRAGTVGNGDPGSAARASPPGPAAAAPRSAANTAAEPRTHAPIRPDMPRIVAIGWVLAVGGKVSGLPSDRPRRLFGREVLGGWAQPVGAGQGAPREVADDARRRRAVGRGGDRAVDEPQAEHA